MAANDDELVLRLNKIEERIVYILTEMRKMKVKQDSQVTVTGTFISANAKS